jgi:hypothetical protein
MRWNQEALLSKTVVAPPPNGHRSTAADDELRGELRPSYQT